MRSSRNLHLLVSEPLLRAEEETEDEEAPKPLVPPYVVESSLTIALQVFFPYLVAGMGMVAAGMVLDVVQVRTDILY